MTGLCIPPKIYLWDAATGEKVQEFAFPDDAACAEGVAFSPDGRTVLAGDRTGRLWMWDAATGEKIREFTGHTDMIWSAAFSPDGRFALSGGGDRTARLWDVSTGIELRRLAGHTSNVLGVAFSPDGRIIVTSGADGTARLWYTDLNDTIDDLCGRLPRDFTEEEREQYDIASDEPTCPNAAPKP